MKRLYRKIVRVIGIIVCSFVGLILVLTLTNLSITAIERHRYPAPGEMIEVGGGKVHILTEGNGALNVVLLGGLGTPSPAIDFSPLISVLKADFTVTTVECFGYGWSDWSRKPRTNQNIVEEVRHSLHEVGILPPYIVVPHSLSGIYTLYWSNKHPEEISAVVGLDPSVPDQLKYNNSSSSPTLLNLARIAGIMRLALFIDPGLLPRSDPAYSDVQMQGIRRMAMWNFENPTVVDESRCESSNLREVQDFKFPSSIPISFILSKDTIQTGKLLGLDWPKMHQDVVAGNTNAKIYIVNGGHYVHRLNSQMIAEVVRETIER